MNETYPWLRLLTGGPRVRAGIVFHSAGLLQRVGKPVGVRPSVTDFSDALCVLRAFLEPKG